MLTHILLALLLVLSNIDERKDVFIDVIWNNANAPFIAMGWRIREYISIFNATDCKYVDFIIGGAHNIFHRKPNSSLNDDFSGCHYHFSTAKRRFDCGAPLSVSCLTVRRTRNAPPHREVNSISAAHISQERIEKPSGLYAVLYDRLCAYSLLSNICTRLDDRHFVLSSCSLKLPLDYVKLTSSQVSQILNCVGLFLGSGNKLLCLSGRGLHIQVAEYRNSQGSDSDKRSSQCGECANPLWSKQAPKFAGAFIASALAFVNMGLAYMWFLFAVAAPRGVRYAWWFDRFDVHMWSSSRRGVVALAFFLISVALIIAAVRLALPHRDLPSSQPPNQISSIRTI